MLDETAASRLKESDYYHWVFENQPEWEPFRTASTASRLNGFPVKPVWGRKGLPRFWPRTSELELPIGCGGF